jgi:prevent-host-death family protein
MNAQYSITAARSAWSSIIDEVAHGREIEITRYGEPVAVVISKQRYEQLQANRPNFVERCLTLRAKHGADALLPDDWATSLRDRSPGREVSL